MKLLLTEDYEMANNAEIVGSFINNIVPNTNYTYKDKVKNCLGYEINGSTLDVDIASYDNQDGSQWNYVDNAKINDTSGKNYKDCDSIDDNWL